MILSQKENCRHFQTCSAALCPLDNNPRHYWHADTEICILKPFPDFVKIQRRIQKVNPDPCSFFTKKMLMSISRVTQDIKGIQNAGYNKDLETSWIERRKNRHNTSVTI